MTAFKKWGPMLFLASGFGLAAFMRIHLAVADPYTGVKLSLLNAHARSVVDAARFTRLWQDVAYGAQVALAVGIIAVAGPSAWARRGTDRLPLAGLAAISWVLIGTWLQRLLLILFRFRLGGTTWNGIISNGLFLVACGVVGVILVRVIVRAPSAGSETAKASVGSSS